MPRIVTNRTCIVVMDRISATQREIVKAMITQLVMFLENVDIIDFYNNDKLEKFVEADDSVLPVVKVMDSYTCTNWDKTFIHFQNVLHQYRNVVLINAPTFRFLKKSPEFFINKYLDKAATDPMYEFEAGSDIHNIIMRSLFIKAASSSFKRNNVIQFVVNPAEADYRKVFNFRVYERIGPSRYWEDTKLGPTYEFALANTYIQNINKVNDVYWRACCENVDGDKQDVLETNDIMKRFMNVRIPGAEYNNPVKGEFGIFNKTQLRKEAVPQNEYYYNLMLSKYTIITSTDDGSYPIVRIMEAIILGCIPILHWDMDKDFQQTLLTDKIFYDIIKYKDLRMPKMKVLVSEVSNRFKVNYGEDSDCIEQFRASSYYKSMTDFKTVYNYYSELFDRIRRVGK